MASDGMNGGAPRGRGAPLPHIGDITATPRDIDPNQSLKRLLDICESSLNSAEMSREFKRPANALKDYIRASIIAVVIVKNHRDFPSMQQDRGGDLERRHSLVLKRLQGLYDIYEGLKDYIRQDNKITHVQPTGARLGTSATVTKGVGSPVRLSEGNSRSNGHGPPTINGPSAKAKPVLKPKPQSLHGNVLTSQHARTSSVPNGVDALASRFASLAGPQASPGQDPRIKTHSFESPARPSGPREMPRTQKPKIGIDSSVPVLPKMPDAIYSPVRGNMSQESASLPTSTPRGFSRTGSGTSNAGTPSAHQPPSKDYFSPVITNAMSAEPSSISRPSMDTTSAVSSPRVSVDIARQKSCAEIIEADGLYQAMKTTGTVLIIDVRPREEYDEGHIMSSSIICIEPAVLGRKDLSADDISQSLVLHDNEQTLFDKRSEFDLVVFYDDSSKTIPQTPSGPTAYALMSLHRALVYLSFDNTLKRRPKLLLGGLSAWIDLMGANSLRASDISRHSNLRLGANPTSPMHQHPHIYRRASKYRIQPLKPDDVRAWQQTLTNEDNEAISPSFHRTTEDFFRRFPEVPIEPEDMAPLRNQRARAHDESPYSRKQPRDDDRKDDDFMKQLAPMPQPPAAAVPRPDHSGSAVGHYHETGSAQIKTATAINVLSRIPQGLHNPGNWCYSNSVLQALLATRLGRELFQGDWRVVPRKRNETIECPQLTMRFLLSVFNQMHGSAVAVSPSVFMGYIKDLCRKQTPKATEIFGDEQQHDASEFFSFILDEIDDESNLKRHLLDPKIPSPDLPKTTGKSPLQFASDYWKHHYSKQHQSLLDKHVTHLNMKVITCSRCNNKTYPTSPATVLGVNLPHDKKGLSLKEALDHTFQRSTVDTYQCDNCNSRCEAVIDEYMPFMPETLCMSFVRFQAGMGYGGGVLKQGAAVSWDLNDFDMEPYFLPPEDCQWHQAPGVSKGGMQNGFAGKFRYETIAIIQHAGQTAGSGHYTTHVRDNTTVDPNAWLLCNDHRVSSIRLDTDAQRKRIFKDAQRVPYLVIMQRKPTL